MVLCILVHGLHAVLLIPLSRLVFRHALPGVCAGIFVAAVPTIRPLPQWESLYAATAVCLFCLASARILRSNQRLPAKGIEVGLICGLILLLNPVLLTICLCWLAFLLISNQTSWRSATTFSLAFGVAAIAVCVPWTIRNYRELGALFFIRDNLGVEMFTSNADCADARDAINGRSGCHHLMQANFNVREAVMVKEMGELAYNRYRLRTAMGWIRNHPSRFTMLTLRRVKEFWFPTPDRPPVYEYALWAVTGLSILGLGWMWKERNPAVWFFLAAMAWYPAIYYVVQASTRFRFPILWISLLPAGLAMEKLTQFAVRYVTAPRTSRKAEVLRTA